jgi:hypothetical protein
MPKPAPNWDRGSVIALAKLAYEQDHQQDGHGSEDKGSEIDHENPSDGGDCIPELKL